MGFVNAITKPIGKGGMFVRSSNIHICVSVCVCVDFRFRFVTVWSEGELQDCNTEELTRCLTIFQTLTDNREFSFALIKEEVDRLCR
jgi:hypothetical protein